MRFDTELQVAQACQHGTLPAHVYERWQAIRPTFEPVTVPEWLDDSALRLAAGWLSKGPGLCWVEHIAAGKRLSMLAGVPYFHAGGFDREKRFVDDWQGPCVLSIAANLEGRNLQHQSRNLIMSAPPGGDTWEQLIGRTHRDGQEADEVTVEVLIECSEQLGTFEQAIRDADYMQRTLAQPQKLLLADIDLGTIEKKTAAWDESQFSFLTPSAKS
jgi:hypothetical protein